MTYRVGYATQTEANVKPVQTEIPTELVEAQREYVEAREEHSRLTRLAEVAWNREVEAERRYSKARAEFMLQVDAQVMELSSSGEGT